MAGGRAGGAGLEGHGTWSVAVFFGFKGSLCDVLLFEFCFGQQEKGYNYY